MAGVLRILPNDTLETAWGILAALNGKYEDIIFLWRQPQNKDFWIPKWSRKSGGSNRAGHNGYHKIKHIFKLTRIIYSLIDGLI